MNPRKASEQAPEPDEFIRVGKDRWSFVGAKTGRRFVPFGSNLVLTNKEDLDIFGPRFSESRYDQVLQACEALNINILKVFLPIGKVLPDPQEPGRATLAPGYVDNLKAFLALCRRRRIRAVVTLAEWWGFQCQWWQEGGQYFGRRPWRQDKGPDSIGTLVDFWRQLCAQLRNDPTVFAYTPCVELSMPSGNLTPPWQPPEDQIGLIPGEIALWYWRRWLQAKYSSVTSLNRAWGTDYPSFEVIPVVSYAYDFQANRYLDGDRMVLDYQNFREWATMRYLLPQLAAIRRADPNHMVTISNHERSWNLWTGAARHFLGYTPAEQAPYVDYLTLHFNRDTATTERAPLEQHLRELEVLLRFTRAGKPAPVILEEFTFGSHDPEETARVQGLMVRKSMGHCSGWLTWYLQYPSDPHAGADAAHPSSWLTDDFKPTPWGNAARDLRDELLATDLKRKAPARVVSLDRRTELVPKRTGILIETYLQYTDLPQPTDYRVTYEKDLKLRV